VTGSGKMEKKKDPLTFLSENKKTIFQVLNRCSNDVTKAWLLLHEKIPEIKGIIKFDDFRNYSESLFFIRNEARRTLLKRIQILETNLYRKGKPLKELKFNQKDTNFRKTEKIIIIEDLKRTIRLTKEKLSNTEKELEIVRKYLVERVKMYEEKKLKLESVYEEKKLIQTKLEEVKQELSERLKQGGIKQNESINEIPKNIDGWTLSLQGPYFRLFKKIDGKTKCIYLGRHFEIDNAKKKIQQKLERLEKG
jgi:hypothetical protein